MRKIIIYSLCKDDINNKELNLVLAVANVEGFKVLINKPNKDTKEYSETINTAIRESHGTQKPHDYWYGELCEYNERFTTGYGFIRLLEKYGLKYC